MVSPQLAQQFLRGTRNALLNLLESLRLQLRKRFAEDNGIRREHIELQLALSVLESR
jgi:hypothetical protein